MRRSSWVQFVRIDGKFTAVLYVVKISRDWVIDRSFTPVAQYATPSYSASSARHGFESQFERFFYLEALVFLKTCSSLVPQVFRRSGVGQRTAVCGKDAPNIPPFRAVGRYFKDYPELGVIDRPFTPIAHSSRQCLHNYSVCHLTLLCSAYSNNVIPSIYDV